MSTKDKIVNLIDGFTEEQLQGLLTMLTGYREIIEEARDDAYCAELYREYQGDTDEDKADNVSLESFAKELGIKLP